MQLKYDVVGGPSGSSSAIASQKCGCKNISDLLILSISDHPKIK